MRSFQILFVVMSLNTVGVAGPRDALPRYTEEREAAALHFVKKNLPELLPLLGELRKGNAMRYQQEIREIFHVTEMLADLQDDKIRHELELKVWKTENRSHILVARLRSSPEDEQKKVQDQLRDLARELVDLEIQVLESQVRQLDTELASVKKELDDARDRMEQNVKSRFDGLLEKAKKPRK